MKSFNVFIVSALLLLISFLGVGYASLTDTLTVGADVSATWIEPSILYTSSASVTSGNAGDTSLRYRLGSEDVANPAAHLFTTLDFSSLAVGESIKITLSIKNNFKVGDLEDTFVFKELQVQIGTGELVSINSEAIQTTPRGVDSTSLEEFNISYDGIDAEIRKANDNRDGDGIEASTVRSGITLTLTKTASTPSSVSANFMFKFGYTSPEVLANAALDKFAEEINANKTVTIDGKTNTVFNHIISEMGKNTYWGGGGDYVGNVTNDDSSTDSQLIEALFGDSLNNLTLDENGEPTNCTVMIKKKNVDDNTATGEDGDELVVMITPDDIPKDYKNDNGWETVTVYVAVFSKLEGGDWVQIGDVYKGIADANNYGGGNTPLNSFDTEKWLATEAYYGLTGKLTAKNNLWGRPAGYSGDEIEDIIAAYKTLNDGADYDQDLAASTANADS